MKRFIRPFLIVALFFSVSSCPTRDRPLPPPSPPPPQTQAMKGYYPGNAPLAGPGFFFYMMMAEQTNSHKDVFN
ncbi:hypothetical protein D3C87_105180 [compost metagenome]